MQDWNYNWNGCFEVTIEISEEFQPPASEIPQYWLENRESMINYLEQVHTGVRGVVLDQETLEPVAARIHVDDNETVVYSDPDRGDFYRLLESGNYNLIVEADGYFYKELNDIFVPEQGKVSTSVYLQPMMKYNFTGIIYDSLDRYPLENVTIACFQQNVFKYSAKTNEQGAFNLLLPEGAYQVHFELDGYFTKEDSINILQDISQDYYMLRIIPGVISGLIQLQGIPQAAGSIAYCQGRTDTVGMDNKFCIDGLNPGRINLFAHATFYKTTHVDTILLNGDSLNINVYLEQGSNTYTFDFELQEEHFTGKELWSRGKPLNGPSFAQSGQNVWGTGLIRNYEDGPALSTLETPVFSILGITYPLLEFYHWFDIEEFYDGGNVKISTDEGLTWQIIEPTGGYSLPAISADYDNPLGGEPGFSGNSNGWEKIEIDLTSFHSTPFISFRFDFGNDQQKGGAGWFIDDFRILEGNATDLSVQHQFSKDPFTVKVFPNPANPGTRIRIQFNAEQKTEIEIINLLGQTINRKEIPAGINKLVEWNWDMKTSSGGEIASGIYFIQLKSPSFSIVRKLVVLR
jgi:hypothetical protein